MALGFGLEGLGGVGGVGSGQWDLGGSGRLGGVGAGPGRDVKPGHPLGAQAPAVAGAYEEGKGGFFARRRSGGRRWAPRVRPPRGHSEYVFVLDVPLERRLFGGLTNPNHWRMSPVRDSQLVNFGPVGGVKRLWLV